MNAFYEVFLQIGYHDWSIIIINPLIIFLSKKDPEIVKIGKAK